MQTAGSQLFELGVLAIPVATIAWTVTHEEVFREWRRWCQWRSEHARGVVGRKFFYLFTCEYCFSFYVSAGAIAFTGFQLLYEGWRGYLVSVLSLVWIANLYMSVYARLRLDIKRERVEIEEEHKATEGLHR